MEKKDWFIPKTDSRTICVTRVNEGESRRASFSLKLCTICNKVYEYFFADNKRQVKYYEGFVTLGLERKTCDKCNKSS